MRKAFTLVEILVVLAIIALLAAILWPSAKRARDKAREVSCITQVHQIGRAERIYSDDYDSWLPIGAYNSTAPWVSGPYPSKVWDRSWHDLLLPYLGNNSSLFICPSVGTPAGIRYCYGASPWLFPYYGAVAEVVVGNGDRIWMAEHQTLDWPSVPRDYYDDAQHTYLKDRHNGRLVVLYLDGHVKSVLPDSLSGNPGLWRP